MANSEYYERVFTEASAVPPWGPHDFSKTAPPKPPIRVEITLEINQHENDDLQYILEELRLLKEKAEEFSAVTKYVVTNFPTSFTVH